MSHPEMGGTWMAGITAVSMVILINCCWVFLKKSLQRSPVLSGTWTKGITAIDMGILVLVFGEAYSDSRPEIGGTWKTGLKEIEIEMVCFLNVFGCLSQKSFQRSAMRWANSGERHNDDRNDHFVFILIFFFEFFSKRLSQWPARGCAAVEKMPAGNRNGIFGTVLICWGFSKRLFKYAPRRWAGPKEMRPSIDMVDYFVIFWAFLKKSL